MQNLRFNLVSTKPLNITHPQSSPERQSMGEPHWLSLGSKFCLFNQLFVDAYVYLARTSVQGHFSLCGAWRRFEETSNFSRLQFKVAQIIEVARQTDPVLEAGYLWVLVLFTLPLTVWLCVGCHEPGAAPVPSAGPGKIWQPTGRPSHWAVARSSVPGNTSATEYWHSGCISMGDSRQTSSSECLMETGLLNSRFNSRDLCRVLSFFFFFFGSDLSGRMTIF